MASETARQHALEEIAKQSRIGYGNPSKAAAAIPSKWFCTESGGLLWKKGVSAKAA
jgi:hypothetical protein